MEWEDVEARVERILSDAGQVAPPVDVINITQSLAIPVDMTRLLTDDVSGCLYYAEGTVVIGVNVRKPCEHQRFTVAHELAHLLAGHSHNLTLHVAHDHEADDVTVQEERLANWFAAALLMPASWVRQEIECGTRHYALARRFKVSPSAMDRRLRELGLAGS